VTRDFVYKLTNRQGRTEVGHENLLFLFRRQQIPPQKVEASLQRPTSSGSPSVPTPRITLGGTKQEQQQAAKEIEDKARKGGIVPGILKVGCNVASIFFPFITGLCSAIPGGLGFAAAEPVRRDNLQPEADAQNMVVQFSFPVKP
jgi:hypothetical protein